MSKSTKEQVKFFIETMTDDMHNTTQHEIAETLLSKFDECESLQAKLLAYEQAAKSPAAKIEWDGSEFSVNNVSGEFYYGTTDVYLAPVLPKQPELLSIGELLHRLEEQTGEKWVEESAQPVSEPYKLPDGYLLLPQVPTQAHLNSIAMRYRHDFYLLNDAQKRGALAVARQMYEECSGQGFYTVPAAPVQESE